MKRAMTILTLLLLALNCMGISAFAQEVPDLGREGELTITMDWGGEPLDGGSLTIYKVAEIAENDGNYDFALIQALGDSGIALDDLTDPDLADQLGELAREKGLTPVTAAVANGEAKFTDLELGLYVVTQGPGEATPGFAPIRSFLISVPQWQDGAYVYSLTADPKVPLETEPVETTEPTEPKPTEPKPTEPSLPQTGQMNWPVPVLAVSGLVFLLMGYSLRFAKKDGREE